VRTFDAGGANNKYLIDEGSGGAREVLEAAPIPTFGAAALSTVNGARTAYIITWYSEITAEVGDKLTIPFPAEIQPSPDAGLRAGEIKCEPEMPSLIRISCTFENNV
jgi:hypothetical protein